MDTLKTISQSVDEVDQMEPIFYGVLLFSSVSVFIMLICVFCCWQQNQLEDYSFVEQLNQRLIDTDRSLLSYPSTHEKAMAAGRARSPTYQTVKRDRFKQIAPKAIYEPPFNPSTQTGTQTGIQTGGHLGRYYVNTPPSPDGQPGEPGRIRLVDPTGGSSSHLNNKESATIRPEPTRPSDQVDQAAGSNFPSKVVTMLKQAATSTNGPKALADQSTNVIVAQEDISRMKVDKRLVAALRLKKLNDRTNGRQDQGTSKMNGSSGD